MKSIIKTIILGGILLGATAAGRAESPVLPFCIVDSGQETCFDEHGEIAPPTKGSAFYGQDAQFKGVQASYTLSSDGLTVQDNDTGLTWQNSPDTNDDGILNKSDKLILSQAESLPAKLNAAKYGGFGDWRLPSIKELYSLFDCRGTDPSGMQGNDTSGLTPFIDTRYFRFVYGDTSRNERVIDSQYASSTKYVGKSPRGGDKLFGVNFADGRIKGYDLSMPGGRMEKTFFVQCVRGNPQYGKNDFYENKDKTITDKATGLIWAKEDSKKGMNWKDALAWVQQKNAEKYLGTTDWRMPNIKELQSIIDYTRSPDTNDSPAIDPVFKCTQFTNEGGKTDYPYYWSSTTHSGFNGGGAAMYVAFGRAAGWMKEGQMPGGADAQMRGRPEERGPGPEDGGQKAEDGKYNFVDVHGAGAQRSDPKAGDPKRFPHGRGPQGDVIRIYNYVRLVRNNN